MRKALGNGCLFLWNRLRLAVGRKANNYSPSRIVYIKNVFLLLQKKTIMDTELIETIREYFKTQPVLKAWIFGSYARGEETEDSDVDILVKYDDTDSTVGLMKIASMYVALKKMLNREVDLVEEGTLLPFAVASADNDKILIYERAS